MLPVGRRHIGPIIEHKRLRVTRARWDTLNIGSDAAERGRSKAMYRGATTTTKKPHKTVVLLWPEGCRWGKSGQVDLALVPL